VLEKAPTNADASASDEEETSCTHTAAAGDSGDADDGDTSGQDADGGDNDCRFLLDQNHGPD